jgi:hypothetical protein
MRKRTPEQLAVGMKAMMRTGSPVRQWIYTLEHKSKAWLTPVPYTVATDDPSEPKTGPQYVEVRIARVMPPYAIVYHHDGRGWVRLWLDTREVPLFAIGE